MPHNLRSRGEVMPASPIRKLRSLANKAEEKGIKVFHLNIGQPDLPTPQNRVGCVTAHALPNTGIQSQ